MNILQNLKNLNLELPQATTPGGFYNSINIRKKIAYVAIQFPIFNGKLFYQGKLGIELNDEEGFKAMELSALNVISQIHNKIGFEKIEGLNHIEAYYVAGENWDEAPFIVNGASKLFNDVLLEKGIHSRSIFGVQKLPRNFSVGLTCSFTLND